MNASDPLSARDGKRMGERDVLISIVQPHQSKEGDSERSNWMTMRNEEAAEQQQQQRAVRGGAFGGDVIQKQQWPAGVLTIVETTRTCHMRGHYSCHHSRRHLNCVTYLPPT